MKCQREKSCRILQEAGTDSDKDVAAEPWEKAVLKPGDIIYQTDYNLVRQRYRDGVKTSRAVPGADADSHHSPIVMDT